MAKEPSLALSAVVCTTGGAAWVVTFGWEGVGFVLVVTGATAAGAGDVVLIVLDAAAGVPLSLGDTAEEMPPMTRSAPTIDPAMMNPLRLYQGALADGGATEGSGVVG
jgi:hypothetical protein